MAGQVKPTTAELDTKRVHVIDVPLKRALFKFCLCNDNKEILILLIIITSGGLYQTLRIWTCLKRQAHINVPLLVFSGFMATFITSQTKSQFVFKRIIDN